jgi:biopolymer transport protein ExbD
VPTLRCTFILNSRSVGWQARSGELKAQLKYRAEWVVYVEADPSLSWEDAVNAMDIISRSGRKSSSH